ncbi:vesicular inhibitory amino acid transporter-like [Diadema setosum]|uniref:vesicular inhibitory amino acid transporter-like n=1 Tax=Diadema setosum TaxID=31175 RepID=UPI003B3BA375
MEQMRTVGAFILDNMRSISVGRENALGEDIELCSEKHIVTRKYTCESSSPEDSSSSETSTSTTADSSRRWPTSSQKNKLENADELEDHHTEDGNEEGTSSAWQACWNVINCMQGIGTLSLPYTVKEGGVAALVTMVVVMFLGHYTSKILVYCMYEEVDDAQAQNSACPRKRHPGLKVTRRVHKTYADIARAYHVYGDHVVNVMQIIDMTSLAALYLQLCGALLVDTFQQAGLSQLAWTTIAAVALLPTVLLKNLTKISWLSLVALLSLVVMYGSVVWYSFRLSIRWDIGAIAKFDAQSFTVSAAIIVFTFGAQFLMPSVEGSMRERTRFNMVLNCSFAVTGIISVAYSLFAFLTFGENTQEFITYNMPLGPLQAVVSCLFVIKSLLTYPLLIFLIVSTVDSMQLSSIPKCYPDEGSLLPPVWAVVFRLLLVALTLLLAVAVPHFSLLMSFTGSLIAPWLDFIFPCIFYLKLRRRSIRLYEQFFIWFIVVFSGVAGLIGIFYSLKALVSV